MEAVKREMKELENLTKNLHDREKLEKILLSAFSKSKDKVEFMREIVNQIKSN